MTKVTAEKVIGIAKKYIGYKEKASNSQLESKTANAGSANYTKFNKKMHQVQPGNMDFPAPWCDAFYDFIILEAAEGDIDHARYVLCGTFDDYTVASAQMYIKAGRYDKNPKPGDQVFFKNSSGINHTGLVTEVTKLMIHTIEGNSGNEVKSHSYLKTAPKIAGYGHPRFDSTSQSKPAESKPTTSTSTALKSIDVIAQEVIDGKWGTGDTRKKKLTSAGYSYESVQNKVNEILKKDTQLKKEKFPLPDGHWYGTPKNNKKNHSGYNDPSDQPAIKKIQKKVGTAADGLYGKNTEAAVIKYQKANKLTADGEVGIKTWTKLFG